MEKPLNTPTLEQVISAMIIGISTEMRRGAIVLTDPNALQIRIDRLIKVALSEDSSLRREDFDAGHIMKQIHERSGFISNNSITEA